MELTTGYTTYDDELLKLIKKVTKLGINVINSDAHISVQCLTIIIDETNKSTREMVDVMGDGKPSPFTWKLGKDEFTRWAKIATSYPYNKINQMISSLVRSMDVDLFLELRKHKNLESEFLEKLYTELQTIGIKTKLSPGVIIRISLIYGGLVDRRENLENFVMKIFEMVTTGRFIFDKCRSCRYFGLRHTGCGRECLNAKNQGYVIPMDMTFGEALKSFPEFDTQTIGDKVVGITKWIPECKKSCVYYKRRF